MNEQAKRARGQGELSVDNIAAEIGEDALRSLFSAYGNVEAVYLGREPSTNRSRGFATVVMSTDEEADHAQADLDTHPLAGRQVRVWRAAGPTSEYEGEEKLCLYVKGLPTDWTHAELNDFFSNFGVIESAKRLPAKMPDSLIPGIVRFITREDAHRALQASNGQVKNPLFMHSHPGASFFVVSFLCARARVCVCVGPDCARGQVAAPSSLC